MWKISILFLVYFFVDVKGADLRIAGGLDANITTYPFLASLLSNGGEGGYVQKCVGSILTTNAILSAATCFRTDGVTNPVSWWRARVGSNFANAGGTVYIINRISVHEHFVPTALIHNLAIVRTNLAITWSNLVQPASIVGAAYSYNDRQRVYAAGWGVALNGAPSQRLQVAEVFLIDQELCASRYYDDIRFDVTQNMVCAGFLDVGDRGQCQGDEGGPLINDSGAVIAVFSHAIGCADLYYPDINTRVSSYTRWIINTATN